MNNLTAFGHLRSLLHQMPTTARFHKVLTTLFDAPSAESAHWHAYAKDILERQWPAHTRIIFASWWLDELRDIADSPSDSIFTQYTDDLQPLWRLAAGLNTGKVALTTLTPMLQVVSHHLERVIVHSVDLGPATITKCLDTLAALKHVHIHIFPKHTVTINALFEAIITHERMHTIQGLGLNMHTSLHRPALNAAHIETLTKTSGLNTSTQLHLCGLGLKARQLKPLLQSHDMFHLALLDLSNNALTDADIPTLLTSPLCGQVRTLILLDNAFSPQGRQQLHLRYPKSLVLG